MSDRRHLLRAVARRRQALLDRRERGVLAAVDRAVRETWRHILSALTSGRQTAIAFARAAAAALPNRLQVVIAESLRGLHAYAFASTAADVVSVLPASARLAAMARAAGLPGAAAAPPPFLTPTVAEVVGVVFPPPPAAVVERIVFATGWEQRIATVTRLAPPDEIAAKVARSFADGTTGAELGRELKPMLQGVQASARRVVRTTAAQVAQDGRMAAYDGLGDLVTGYQIHAVRDSRTRPEHASRDKTIYYRNPGPGQQGLDAMPRPPLEADGTVAHNCRCWLTPVLRPPSDW